MARRRSLNRRWSRRSTGGTGILNDDSNIIDQDDDVWWKQLENNTNSIRPSGRISVGECSASTVLSANSEINDSASTGEWWEALQKTSQDLLTIKSINKSKKSPNKDIISSSSNSETEDRLREIKKQRVNLRRTRKSVGKNAFSLVLESSETEIESEPVPSRNTQLIRKSDKLPEKSWSSKSRQQSKNNSIASDNSISSDRNEIRKTRTAIFKKPRRRISHNAFDDVLESDESAISLSQSIEKSGRESDVASKQIDNKISITHNKSLNQSDKSVTKSLNENPKNNSPKENIKNKTSQTILSSPANLESKQNLSLPSDSQSGEIDVKRKKRIRRSSEKDSGNLHGNIVNDNDTENSVVSSKEQSIKHSDSGLLASNKTSTDDENSKLNLHLSSGHSDRTVDNKIRQETSMQRTYESAIKRSKTYESDESETTSISEALKIGYSNQLNVSEDNNRLVSSDKMNYSNRSFISNEILKDWDSDDSANSDRSDKKLNQSNSNVAKDNKSIEINNENAISKRVSQRLRSQSKHNMEGYSRKENSLQNNSKFSHEKDIIMSIEDKQNSDKMRQSPENILFKESKASDKKILIKKPTGKRSLPAKIVITTDSSEEETFIKRRTRKRVYSTRNSDKSKNEDDEIPSAKSDVEQLFSNEQEKEKIETNNNTGVDSSQMTPITTRQSQKASKSSPNISGKSLNDNSIRENKLELDVESDSENENIRDPSAYELPDMNRSDSVTLSDSDNENVFEDSSIMKNPNSTVHGNRKKNRSPVKKKNETLTKLTDLAREKSAEPSPSTPHIPNESSVRKSSVNTSGRKFIKIDLSNRTYVRDSIPAQSSSHIQPIEREPLPTEEDVRDFKEKLKVAAMKLDENIRPYKERLEKELDEIRIKSLKQKNTIAKKIMPLRKKKLEVPKVVDRAYIVNDKVYKQPKLPRPKHWATDRLYKYLWKKMEPKYKLETRVRSEKFVIDLAAVVTIVTRRKKYDNYKGEVDVLMKKMARLGIIETRNDFYHFCYDFLPYEFRSKVTPILQPGNKTTIPYDPDIVDVPLLNE